MAQYSLGSQISTVEDFHRRRVHSSDKAVRYENDVLGAVVNTLKWLERNEDDLRVAMQRIKAEREVLLPEGDAAEPDVPEAETRVLEKMATVVAFADGVKREMRERGVRQLTRVCPDHPCSLIRVSMMAANDHFRMACTETGCSYRMTE